LYRLEKEGGEATNLDDGARGFARRGEKMVYLKRGRRNTGPVGRTITEGLSTRTEKNGRASEKKKN